MKIGLMLPLAEDETAGFADLRAMAIAAEEGGLDSVWGADHLIFREGDDTTGIHESWTVLTAVAAATSRVEIGPARPRASLPQPGADRQDGRRARRGQRRTPDPRAGMRLAPTRVRCLRLPLRPPRLTLRRGARDRRPASSRRAGHLRRALPPRDGRRAPAEADPPRRTADPDRRQAAAHARAGGAAMRTSGTRRGTATPTRHTSCASGWRTSTSL